MQSNLLRFQKDKIFTFIDLETFNLCLNFCYNRCWQIGILKTVDDKVIESHEIYVKWDSPLKIGEEAARITKFNQHIFNQRAIPSEEAFEIMYKALEEADYIVGHNTLNFDFYLIYEYYKMYGKDPRGLVKKAIDTHCLAKAIKLNLKPNDGESLLSFQYGMMNIRQKGLKTNLTAMGKEYEIEFDYESLHSAIQDLILNKLIWDKMKYQLDI